MCLKFKIFLNKFIRFSLKFDEHYNEVLSIVFNITIVLELK